MYFPFCGDAMFSRVIVHYTVARRQWSSTSNLSPCQSDAELLNADSPAAGSNRSDWVGYGAAGGVITGRGRNLLSQTAVFWTVTPVFGGGLHILHHWKQERILYDVH